MSVEVSYLQLYIISSTQETYFNYTIVCYEFPNYCFNCKIFTYFPYMSIPTATSCSLTILIELATEFVSMNYRQNLRPKIPQEFTTQTIA